MEMFTWDYLASAAGATAFVTIVTQLVKNAPLIKKIPTQLVSYIVSLLVMFSASFFTGSLTGPSAALIPLNAVVVMLAANGAYDTVSKKVVSNGNK